METQNPFLNPRRLAQARQEQVEALIKETQVLARRAPDAENRAALAELEAGLTQMRDRWQAVAESAAAA